MMMMIIMNKKRWMHVLLRYPLPQTKTRCPLHHTRHHCRLIFMVQSDFGDSFSFPLDDLISINVLCEHTLIKGLCLTQVMQANLMLIVVWVMIMMLTTFNNTMWCPKIMNKMMMKMRRRRSKTRMMKSSTSMTIMFATLRLYGACWQTSNSFALFSNLFRTPLTAVAEMIPRKDIVTQTVTDNDEECNIILIIITSMTAFTVLR